MKSLFAILFFSTLCNLLQAQISDSTTVVQPVPIETDYNNEIFTIVEDSPEFPGGQDSLMSYLMNNIKYPHAAMEDAIQGTVYVTFVIETDGAVSHVRVLRGIGGGCDEEAVRVVTLMPDWKPGYQDGEPVRVQFNLPIRFILRD